MDEERKRRVRSFVIRTSRMSDHQKEAYRELYPVYGVDPKVERIELNELFGCSPAERQRYLEIGFGMGYSLAAMADAMRGADFLGIEVHRPGVGKLLSEIRRLGLENLRVIQGDAVELLRGPLEDAKFHGIHIFFPDPWPKKRHHKRRLIQGAYPDELAQHLYAGGYLYAVTDWEEYAEAMLEALSRSGKLENKYDGYAPRQPWRPETPFERKGVAKSHAIRELFFLRSR
ncbi:MAG: tRNA (guanosine(46)-N7)-methyltransferase TrmB [Spirochaetaceae bacterium]